MDTTKALLNEPQNDLKKVSLPYVCFCPDPKHFIVNFEEKIVKYAETNGGKRSENANIYINTCGDLQSGRSTNGRETYRRLYHKNSRMHL